MELHLQDPPPRPAQGFTSSMHQGSRCLRLRKSSDRECVDMRKMVLFPHQFDARHICVYKMPVSFSIAFQIPGVNSFSLSDRNVLPSFKGNHNSFYSTKLAMAHLLATFLRLATAPSADRCTLSTFTHNVYNVKRGRKLLLRHTLLNITRHWIVYR